MPKSKPPSIEQLAKEEMIHRFVDLKVSSDAKVQELERRCARLERQNGALLDQLADSHDVDLLTELHSRLKSLEQQVANCDATSLKIATLKSEVNKLMQELEIKEQQIRVLEQVPPPPPPKKYGELCGKVKDLSRENLRLQDRISKLNTKLLGSEKLDDKQAMQLYL